MPAIDRLRHHADRRLRAGCRAAGPVGGPELAGLPPDAGGRTQRDGSEMAGAKPVRVCVELCILQQIYGDFIAAVAVAELADRKGVDFVSISDHVIIPKSYAERDTFGARHVVSRRALAGADRAAQLCRRADPIDPADHGRDDRIDAPSRPAGEASSRRWITCPAGGWRSASGDWIPEGRVRSMNIPSRGAMAASTSCSTSAPCSGPRRRPIMRAAQSLRRHVQPALPGSRVAFRSGSASNR